MGGYTYGRQVIEHQGCSLGFVTNEIHKIVGGIRHPLQLMGRALSSSQCAQVHSRRGGADFW